MLRDLGSRDIEFIETVEYIRYTMLKKSAKNVQFFWDIAIQKKKKKSNGTSPKRSGLLRNEEKFPNIFDFSLFDCATTRLPLVYIFLAPFL